MCPLPIDPHLPKIVAAVRTHRRLVLVAPPGTGKTTRVAPALLAAGLLHAQHPNLVMLQPRRVAARASAQRIAEENGWELGREVGYHIRFEKRLTPQTRLRVLTEGVLTRRLLHDPFLEGIGAVLLDEFHERSLDSDMAVALLREMRTSVREDLILVVMSATLDAEPVAKFLGDCPIVRVEGRPYPVQIDHWPSPPRTPVSQQAADAVLHVLDENTDPGDVLVFLPGVREIMHALHRLQTFSESRSLFVVPLHGSLPARDQLLALHPAPPGKRKIILATNIAETSLTIDGVRTVIDTGLARMNSYDARRGLDRLELQRISQASATQRSGRAGRTGPGRCVRLWPAREDRLLEEFTTPEVARVDLSAAVLALHAWGQGDPAKFGWYQTPPEPALRAADALLTMLGALTPDGRITPLGKRILALPVHPRLGCLLVTAAQQGKDGAALAALLSEKDILSQPPDTLSDSDLLARLAALHEAQAARFAPHLRDRGIDIAAARQTAQTRDQLQLLTRRLSDSLLTQPDEEAMLRLILTAYPDRVCHRRDSDNNRAVMVGGSGVMMARESTVRAAPFFVALDARHDERSPSREALVRLASAVRVEWLTEMFPHEIRRTQDVVYDPQRERAVLCQRVYYRDLLLHEDRHGQVDDERAHAVLSEALRTQARDIFGADETAAQVLARVAFLRQWMPEHPWPAFDDTQLADLLAQGLTGKRTLAELRRQPLAPLLLGQLAYPLDRLLEQHAPAHIIVPSGSRMDLRYAGTDVPVFAVRLQEFFGWTQSPRLAGGRVNLRLHLLGPNYRPVQITDDLPSFWSTTYFQVRKDLRVRYPRHSWPDDPLTAKPVAKGRSRK